MHRYSTGICWFLLHNIKYTNFKNERQTICSEDVSLQESTFPTGSRPILFITAKNMPVETIFQSLKEYLLPTDRNDVTVIHRLEDEDELQNFTKLCEDFSWKIVAFDEITGSEATVIVLFQIHNANRNFEYHSRAKQALFIVHE